MAARTFRPTTAWDAGLSNLAAIHRRLVPERRDSIDELAEELTQRLRSGGSAPRGLEILSADLINAAVAQLGARFDPSDGGFSPAPKFPQSTTISLLLRYHHQHGDAHALEMATLTLDRMAAGGIYDHLGGGFHRYSTDARWLAPHFEKMLYDNALLARAYLEAFQVTRKRRLRPGRRRDPAMDDP